MQSKRLQTHLAPICTDLGHRHRNVGDCFPITAILQPFQYILTHLVVPLTRSLAKEYNTAFVLGIFEEGEASSYVNIAQEQTHHFLRLGSQSVGGTDNEYICKQFRALFTIKLDY